MQPVPVLLKMKHRRVAGQPEQLIRVDAGADLPAGLGDAVDPQKRVAEIYAEAYSKDRDFYAFYRSMQAYRQSIGREQDVLVLQPDSDFFRFLQNQLGTSTK